MVAINEGSGNRSVGHRRMAHGDGAEKRKDLMQKS